MRSFIAVVALLTGLVAGAEVPDLTGSLEYMGNPASSRWPSSAISRQVQDLQPYRGKIYTSGGEWGNNTGPCPCFAVDPYSGAYTNEFDAGTDAIYEFKEFSDGRLYTSAIDIHEGAANYGSTFRKESNGVWRAYTTCNVGSITNLGSSSWQGYMIHNWDMAEYKKKVFVCGYGISGSSNWCEKAMFNASPSLKSCYRRTSLKNWTSPSGSRYAAPAGYQYYRRFCAFLPFDDDLYCIPMQIALWNDVTACKEWEEWRWNDAANRFDCQTNSWTGIAPNVTTNMMRYGVGDGMRSLQLWHPTKFKNRVLYILSQHNYNITPWAAYSAVNENHHIKATKIDLGSDDVLPFDIYPTKDAVFLVAAKADASATEVENSVWKSTDGVNFTRIFTFRRTRQASALCYYDGHFYLGMGSFADVSAAWPKVKTEMAGNIYRVPYPLEALGVVAETNRLSCVEGATGAVRFRLSAAPVTNVTLQVRAAVNPSLVVKTPTLVFTPSDWNVWKTVNYEIVENADVEAHPVGAIICGAEGADIASGSARVTVVDNDVPPTADGLAFGDVKDVSVRVSANVTGLGALNGTDNASVKVAFELYPDAGYSNAVAGVTNSVTSTGVVSARLTGLVHDTRYYARVEVIGAGGMTAVLKGNVITDEEGIPNEDQIPEKRDYLVYEGFSTNDYKLATSGYGSVVTGGPVGIADSIGTAAAATKWDAAGSTQLLAFKASDGLRLPRAMREAGFKARGTSVGTNPANSSSNSRGAYRPLAAGVLSPTNTPTGRYCFRVLLNVDPTAMNVAKKEGWLISVSNASEIAVNAYGASFCRKALGKNYGVHLTEPSAIGFYLARNTNDMLRAYMRTVSADGVIQSKVLGEAQAGVTYICYAEVELKDGADVIRGGYQPVGSYTNDIPWMVEATNDVFTATSYPNALAFGGCYGTNGGYFRADEFAVGTKLDDVLATRSSAPTEPDPGPGPGTDPDPSDPEEPPSAPGRLLVNEGFSLDDYATPSGTYGTCLSAIVSKSQASLGFTSATKWNTMGSNQPLIFTEKEGTALPLPAAMTNAGFRAVGTSVGLNPAENNSSVRAAYRTFASGTLAPTNTETGTYCFRVLLNVDSAAFAKTVASASIVRSTGTSAPNVNYYGAGFTTAPGGNCYGILTSQPATLAFFVAKNAANEARIVFRTVSADGLTEKETDLGPATLGSTHICYAEVKVNATGDDTIRAGCQLVKDYTTDLVWQGAQTNDVISADVYPAAIAIGGCYGTNKGNFRADELAIGTSLQSVLAVPAGSVEPEVPVIGGTADEAGVAFGQDAEGRATFGVTVSNAKAGLTYQAYAAERLTDEFRPYGEPIRATADGALPIVVPTDGKASLFVKIVFLP